MGKQTILTTSTPNFAPDCTSIDCAEFDRLLAEALDRAHLPPAGLRHLDECAHCATILADFEAMADKVRLLSLTEADHVPDQWPQIRDALLQEGIIHATGQDCAAAAPSRAPRLVHRRRQ